MAEEKRGVGSRIWGAAKRGWNSPLMGRASIAVIGLAVVIAVISVVLSLFAPVNPGEEATPVGPSSSPLATVTVPANAGTCNVPAGDTSFRPALPKDLRWVASQGVTWPVSDTAGPTAKQEGFDACFARSPLGAALAATTVTYSQYNGHTVNQAVEFYVTESPGKKIYYDKAGSAARTLTTEGIAPAGFITNEFTPDAATITLVFSYPKAPNGYFGVPTSLVWADGDWKIKVLDNGDSFVGNPSTPVKGQFVPWAGS